MVSSAEMESKSPELHSTSGEGEEAKSEDHQEPPIQFNPGITVPVTGKKRRGKKSQASRSSGRLTKSRGNGFEGRSPGRFRGTVLTMTEFFADPPMTPQEALEEKDEIYHP